MFEWIINFFYSSRKRNDLTNYKNGYKNMWINNIKNYNP